MARHKQRSERPLDLDCAGDCRRAAVVGCDGDEEQQGAAEMDPPSADQQAQQEAESEVRQPQAAAQPAASEPIQWSEDRCLTRLEDSRLFHEDLQVRLTDHQGDIRLGETARARFRWETSIQPTLDELSRADQDLADHCAESFDEYLEVSEELRKLAEEELAAISDNRRAFDPGAAGWTNEQCDRRFVDINIYAAVLLDYALVDLEETLDRGDSDLAQRIRETRIDPAIDEFTEAVEDISENCERLEAAEAEIGADFAELLQAARNVLGEVKQRYAELIDGAGE